MDERTKGWWIKEIQQFRKDPNVEQQTGLSFDEERALLQLIKTYRTSR